MTQSSPQPIRLLLTQAGKGNAKSFRLNESAVTVATKPGRRWAMAEMQAAGSNADAWEQAYEAVRAGKAQYAEPDAVSGFIAPTPLTGPGRRMAGSGGQDQGIANEQNPKLEMGSGFAWHLRDEYSGLATARRMANAGNPSDVRIAIFDVGFDLNHLAIPPRLNLDLARNFTGGPLNDITDPGDISHPGHGTGTMSILASGPLPQNMQPAIAAGQTLGAIPEAEIVPLRIAGSVVLLRTSAFAEALEYCIGLTDAGGEPIDVISMSMGGTPSKYWTSAVNRAYEAGITMVCAAGNTKIQPLKIVYPARYGRVIAACGAMANLMPYRDVPLGYMFGCYGPDDKMDTAIAAFTPNIPWAEMNSPNVIDLDGQGTSSATPQVAAAAGLWLRKYKAQMAGRPGWQVVEAVRHALFSTASTTFPEYRKYFGNGILQAHRAMDVPPDFSRPKQAEDRVFFAAKDIIFGIVPEAEMAEVELAQLAQKSPEIDALIDGGNHEALREAIEASAEASPTLKKLARKGQRPKKSGAKKAPPSPVQTPTALTRAELKPQKQLEPPDPENRRLQAFAYDPLLSTETRTFEFNCARLDVPWEKLERGPAGEYLEVIDVDPPANCVYEPVDLDDSRLLATDGFTPSIGNPQFHQQMVYAVAMRTIHRFEMGLGRRVMWSPRMTPGDPSDKGFVQRLRVHPHALYEENAYYDPSKKALLFGYFNSRPKDAGALYKGGMVFSCLSHDIIAHETTHAILDGIYREYGARTNPDQLAFHEAFADLVAMFQHFRIREAVVAELGTNAGDIGKPSALLDLAREFGKATGMHGALRTGLSVDPSPDDYAKAKGAHARGAVLVGAVFAAFVRVYQRQTADLVRIATGGTGQLPPGALHPDLVNRLAGTASAIAANFLDICIRALDYCPPADLTFGDYLRAMVTADYDLVRDDPHGYRVAIIEAFRQRGIYPSRLRALSEDTLLWRPPDLAFETYFSRAQRVLRDFAVDMVELDPGPGRDSIPKANARRRVFERTRWARADLHEALDQSFREMPEAERDIVMRSLGLKLVNGQPRFQVHTLFLADRVGPQGRVLRQFVISLLQKHRYADGIELQSGSTILVERGNYGVRYVIRKGAENEERLKRNHDFAAQSRAAQSTYFQEKDAHQFAALHAGVEEEAYG